MHETAQISLRNLHREMVVCHENISMKDNAIPVKGIRQTGEELLIICIGDKNLFPLISSCGSAETS